jgi:hypothetical protein
LQPHPHVLRRPFVAILMIGDVERHNIAGAHISRCTPTGRRSCGRKQRVIEMQAYADRSALSDNACKRIHKYGHLLQIDVRDRPTAPCDASLIPACQLTGMSASSSCVICRTCLHNSDEELRHLPKSK